MSSSTIQGFNLSPQQKHIWSLQDGCDAFFTRCALTIEGQLRLDRLQAAAHSVTEKHDILRTTLIKPFGLKFPLQQVADTGLNASPLSVDLALSSSRESVLCLRLPALFSDRVSILSIAEELGRTYATVDCNAARENPDFQYAQYAQWKNESVDLPEAEAEQAIRHWTRQVTPYALAARLPFRLAACDAGRFRFSSVPFISGGGLLDRIHDSCGALGVSPDRMILACWHILLSRFAGQTELVVGTAFNGRHIPGLETSVGLFEQYLPVSSQAAGVTFREFVASINGQMDLNAEHQDYFSLETLDAFAERQPGERYFPFGFDFYDQPSKCTFGDHDARLCALETCTDAFELKLECARKGSEIRCSLAFDESCFRKCDVERLAEQLEMLIASAAADPGAMVCELKIVSPRARQQLITECEGTERRQATEECLTTLFEDQVSRTPDRTAIVAGSQQLSFAGLNGRANQLAHYLQTIGAAPEQIVGIWMDRTVDAVVAMLGCLKSGAAYLPIDSALPAARVARVLADTGTRIVVTGPGGPPANPGALERLRYVASDSPLVSACPSDNPPQCNQPQHLAYVLFTSGSTGTPKAVGVEHRNICNYVRGILDRLKPSDGASFGFISPLSADLGYTMLFPSLCMGGTLHMIPQTLAFDVPGLCAYFTHHRIDLLKITPSHLTAILSDKNPGALIPRQQLILGGEVCRWELIDRIRQLNPDCAVFNHYGPTETTVGVLAYLTENDSGTHDRPATVPLGKAIANARVYVLDSLGDPVAPWVSGEIYVGGPGVTRGYLNSTDITNEKFIPDPFRDDRLGKLYRTGDVARRLPDGNIEFMGRNDAQIKIRGYRVELGEIESVLLRHPSVTHAVALLRDPASDQPRITAYVTASERRTNGMELRRFLSDRLPDYMVPAETIVLDSFPLTANGKVDRIALADLRADQRPELVLVEARTATEQKLAGIWAQVLKSDRIGMNDNFFDLGGDSLLAIQVIAKSAAAGIQMTVQQLFRSQTVAGLAAELDKVSVAPGIENHSLVPVHTGGTRPPLFCVLPDTLFDALYNNLSAWLGSDQPLYALRPSWPGSERMEQAQIVARIIAEICSIQSAGPYFLAGYCSGARLAFEIAQWFQDHNRQIAFLGLIESASPGYGRDGASLYISLRFHYQKMATMTAAAKGKYLWQIMRLHARRRVMRAVISLSDKFGVAGHSITYHGAAHLFRAEDHKSQDSPALGWNRLVSNLSIHKIAGDHDTVLDEPHIRDTASQIRALLKAIGQKPVEHVQQDEALPRGHGSARL